VRRRQGSDSGQIELHSRRIYILPTRAGLLYGTVVLILLISSMNFSNNMGFALTFLLAAVGLVSMHHCQRNLGGLQLRLAGFEAGFAGEGVGVRLLLMNPSRNARWRLRCGWDRSGQQHLELPGGAKQTITLPLPASRRGPLPVPRISISTSFPLGLLRAWSWVHLDAAALVWPQPAEYADFPAVAATEDNSSQATDHSGDDLSGVRDFRSGDSPRRIDWKALARYDQLLVREYQDGSATRTWLDWDSLQGLATEARLSVLTRLALDAHNSGSLWGLRLPYRTVPPDTGTGHLHLCLDLLAMHGFDHTRTAPQ
jgi:uncharacterized protein (DUF58 family)